MMSDPCGVSPMAALLTAWIRNDDSYPRSRWVNRRCLKLPELDRRAAVMPEVLSTELGVQAATTPIGRRWPGRPAVSFSVDGVPLSLSVQEGCQGSRNFPTVDHRSSSLRRHRMG